MDGSTRPLSLVVVASDPTASTHLYSELNNSPTEPETANSTGLTDENNLPLVASDADLAQLSAGTIKSSWKRWLVLSVYAMVVLICNFMMMAFAPVGDKVATYYNVSQTAITWLALVFMISGFSIRFVAMWFIDTYGLNRGMFLATGLNMLGGVLRWVLGRSPDGFAGLLTGQSVAACAMAFVDIPPPMIAANWFPKRERTIATALGFIAQTTAFLVAYVVAPNIIVQPSDIPLYLFIQAVISVITGILVFLFFRSTPPNPPSASAVVQKSHLIPSIKFMCGNRNFLLLLVVFCTSGGGGQAIATLLPQMVEPYNYSQTDAGNMGALWIFTASIGAVLYSFIVDRTHAYRGTLIIGHLFIIAGLGWITLVLSPNNFVNVCVAICFVGFLGFSCAPIAIEAGVEIAYPVQEATCMGILSFGGNSMGALLTLLLESFPGRPAFVFLMGVFAISLICIIFFSGSYRRLIFEKQLKNRAPPTIPQIPSIVPSANPVVPSGGTKSGGGGGSGGVGAGLSSPIDAAGHSSPASAPDASTRLLS